MPRTTRALAKIPEPRRSVVAVWSFAAMIAAEVLERGRFTGKPMPTTGSCGDRRKGSWLGWRLRVYHDLRRPSPYHWVVTPADRPTDQRGLLMHVVLTAKNVATVETLADELLASYLGG